MSKGVHGVGVAVPFSVPLEADAVLGPRLVYGSMRISPSLDDNEFNALIFPMDDDSIGRVTFEGLDAVRASRGEFLPYDRQDVPYTKGEWVYVIEGSGWLAERHRYELGAYDTPLLERYDHYLFSFHDEFVEAIARGLWFDRPVEGNPLSWPVDHPLLELPESAITERSTSFGIDWERRTNPLPVGQLVESLRLCSQQLLQHNLVLDGRSREHASVWIRTRRGQTVSSFVTGLFGRERHEHRGVADATTFSANWLGAVEAVSTRRRDKGLQ